MIYLAFEVDHIIPLKHGGSNPIENLTYACPHCNHYKGSDFATNFRRRNYSIIATRSKSSETSFLSNEKRAPYYLKTPLCWEELRLYVKFD